MLPSTYRVTMYDPAHRDEHGRYNGPLEPVSDHGEREAAHLRAIEAFAVDAGVEWLHVREPMVPSFVHFGVEPLVEGFGLDGLIPGGVRGFHDGAVVSLATGLELVRVESFAELTARLSGAVAACLLSMYAEERVPLFTAVMPDEDGVVRARWGTDPTPDDRTWAFLTTLRRGQVVTGTVTRIAPFGVTFVDVEGFEAFINIPELSWRRFEHPSDVVSVGERIRAEVLDADLVRGRLALSLKGLQDDPMRELTGLAGRTVRGRVTKLIPFGVFVRVEDRPDGFEGLVHNDELLDRRAEDPQAGIAVGDEMRVKVLAVDPPRRRITLSERRADEPES
ncbi:S1 RNA-binding domain-containing protein [Streptomyces zhihengii]